MARTIPTVNTSRLIMRAMRPQDFEDYCALWALPDVVKYLGGEPWNRTRSWNSFLFHAGHWHMTGFGVWAVLPHGESRVLGQAGFFMGSRDLGDDFDSYPEASWVLHPEVHRQGLGWDAAKAAHDWFDRVVTGPLVCKVHPENTASVKLAERLGYKDLREAEWDGSPARLMIRKTPPGGPRNLLA